MEQYILSSFVWNKIGGNKAAVVFDEEDLDIDKMKRIAKKNNLSETAFVKIKDCKEDKVAIRYFTPEEEVEICGHAALASFYILKEKSIIQGFKFLHCAQAGNLEVYFMGDLIFIEMAKPELVCEVSLEDILEFTSVDQSNIIENKNGLVSVISTGLKDIILEVKDIETLKGLTVNKEKMIQYCKEKDFVGMHIVSRETIEEDSNFSCRNLAPAVGIDEESATGTSNASLLYYMIDRYQLDPNKVYKVEQGYFMNSRSNIYVKAELQDGKMKIFVGGKVALLEEQGLHF